MFGRSDIVQNLKLDILDLKKELASSKDDNQLLKVKIRKLENEVSKRDRQIETLLDPRKSGFVRKVISDRGAAMLWNLRERNLKLEKTLMEKEFVIKRLQSDLLTKKLYTVKDRKRSVSRHAESNFCDIHIPYCEQNLDSDSEELDVTKALERNLKSISMYDIGQGVEKLCRQSHSARSTTTQRAVSADRTQPNKSTSNDVKAPYDGLSRSHLLSIIESLKNNQRKLSPRIQNMESPDRNLERNELHCDTPHLEIQQLQNYFMDMLTEVDQLKATIVDLKSGQDNTVRLLKQKASNVVKLSSEAESLKRPKTETKRPISNSPQLCMSKKRTPLPVKNVPKTQEQSRVKTIDRIRNEAEEKEINVCTYTETERSIPQQKEDSLQTIQTRTISIQKFEDESKYNQRTETESEYFSNHEQKSSKMEEATRKEKFNNLLKQMLQKSVHKNGYKITTDDEDEDLPTEYI